MLCLVGTQDCGLGQISKFVQFDFVRLCVGWWWEVWGGGGGGGQISKFVQFNFVRLCVGWWWEVGGYLLLKNPRVWSKPGVIQRIFFLLPL